jgi:hypothetical protein
MLWVRWGRHRDIGCVLSAPILINFSVELQLLHAYSAEGTRNRDGKCSPPYDAEGLSEGLSHLVSERLLQCGDDRDRRERDLGPLRELL